MRKARHQLGRRPKPHAAAIDSQSEPTTESGGPLGFDAGKRIHGRKRHIVTETNGLLLAVLVHPANVQDVHGAVPLLEALRDKFPRLSHVYADRIYRGEKLRQALAHRGRWKIEIVAPQPPGVKRLPALAAQMVERTFARLGRCRRLANYFECSTASATAWLLIAHFRLLARPPKTKDEF